VGSKVIRAFGIFNTNVSEDNQMLYGIPFPGDYLIAPDGTVRDKVFLPDYQYRPTVSELMLRNFADDSGATAVEVVTSPLTARISLSTDRCFPGQELGVALKFNLRPAWHVYGKPLPDNYQHVEVVFDGEIVGRQSFEFPPAKPVMLKALGETLPVYEGEFRALGKLGIKWSPPPEVKFLGDSLGKRIEPGPYKLIGTLRFQACSDEVCEPPQAIRFELPLTLEADVPTAASKAD